MTLKVFKLISLSHLTISIAYTFFLVSYPNLAYATSAPLYLGENIMDYGAIPNDNIDDSEAIILALNAAKEESKRIIIPIGTFTLNQMISLPDSLYSNIEITGFGSGSIIAHVGGEYAFHLGNGTSSSNGIKFQHFTIKATNNAAASAALFFQHSRRTLINQMTITGYSSSTNGENNEGGAAIKYENSWIHTIRDSKLINNYSGVTVTNGPVNSLNIDSTAIEGSIKYGIYLKNGYQTNIINSIIEGGTIENAIYCSHACVNVNVKNNYFEGIDGVIIHMGNSSSNFNINISGNYLAAASSSSADVVKLQNIRGATIVGNTFSKNIDLGGAYISLGRADGGQYIFIQGNSTKPELTSEDWEGVDFITYINVDGTPAAIDKKFIHTGLIYDNKTKTHFYGTKDSFEQLSP